ncbi:MAG: AgmX/PglI C-terminal domain-containing protein [candidate division KSB1 bacterium]|jgi:TonB family protein|nr:AgmX/PglI C-terminal domain-containing protein [candidate division KSB1 bacterium]
MNSELLTKQKDHNLSGTGSIYIEKFPREFKKNMFETFDWRFALILLVSLAFHVWLILFLENEFPAEFDTKAIVKIQQQYVDLLVDETITPTEIYDATESDDYIQPLDYETITGLSTWMYDISEEVMSTIEEMPGFGLAEEAVESGGRISETAVPTIEEMSTARAYAEDARNLTRTQVEGEVGSIGLLGLIGGSGSELVDYEYIDDLLGYADLNAEHLESVLSKLNAIQVPRHHTAGYILSYRRGGEVTGGKLKGGRVLVDRQIEEAIKDIQPLEEAQTKTVERTTTYEDVPSSPLSKLRSVEDAPRSRRPEDVVRVVQSHKLALQDCYKQVLRDDPTIRGKIIIRFTIDPEGRVIDAEMVSSSLNSPEMEGCIINRIKNWRDFPLCHPSAGNMTYKQVFNFGS